MYQVRANGVLLFSSSDIQVVRRVYRLYQRLYVWSTVQLKKVSL